MSARDVARRENAKNLCRRHWFYYVNTCRFCTMEKNQR